MIRIKPLLTSVLLLAIYFAGAQVSIDHPIQLTGSGSNAKLTGIQSVNSNTDAVSVNALQMGNLIYATDSGADNNIVLNVVPPVTAYQTGMVLNFISGQTVTGPATLNINNMGAIPVKKNINQDLTGCDIQKGQFVAVGYDGTNFQMFSVSSGGGQPATPGTISGLDSICPYTTGVVYSINPVNGATGYNWTVPSGDTIVVNNGTSITVDFGANSVGNVTVSASNACGTGTASTLAISTAGLGTLSGGVVSYDDSGGTYYTFLNSGTFSVTGCGNVDVLVVAGGGGGGSNSGGGGGGGGVIYQSNYFVSSGSYTVTVGAGAPGQGESAPATGVNTNIGGNSSFGTLVAIGGGGGGSRAFDVDGNLGGTGGSGGGAGGGQVDNSTGASGGSDTLNQGNNGGQSSGDVGCPSTGGGGGGAGSAGGNGTNGAAGNGGNGATYFGATYGGGGGGGGGGGEGYCTASTAGTGGSGGGGNGNNNYQAGFNGTDGLGGGGGGGGSVTGGVGGNGGSGVVIIRFP